MYPHSEVSLRNEGSNPTIGHAEHCGCGSCRGALGEDEASDPSVGEFSETMEESTDGTGPSLVTLEEFLALETGAGTSLTDRLKGMAALVFGPSLRTGSTGAAVSALQRALIALGHDLAVDGVFGPNTARAVRAFQAGNGLTADGIAGPQTKSAIANALSRRDGAPVPQPVSSLPSAPSSSGAARQPVPAAAIPIPVPQICVAVPQLASGERACRTVDPGNFASEPGIRSFCQALAACAASRIAERRARGQSSSARASVLADVSALARDFADTMRAARGRWSNCSFNTVARGWMFGRREEVDFETIGAGGRYLNIGALLPPREQDRLEPLVGKPQDAPVQPLLNRLLTELNARHPVRVNNYSRRHGGGSFSGRGYSVDLYIRGGQDERGFYHRNRAVAMLLALDQAAGVVGAEWRVLYNDYAVAAAINRHTGIRRVVFIGSVRPGGTNLNWHGPLILHFHLDIAPKRA